MLTHCNDQLTYQEREELARPWKAIQMCVQEWKQSNTALPFYQWCAEQPNIREG
jgi:hypothetical protein